jgi:hypothetical protein
MKKLLILAIVLLMLPVVNAEKVMYNGIPVYFMHYKINQNICIEMFDEFNPSYFDGIKMIKINDRTSMVNGNYAGAAFDIFLGYMYLFRGCNSIDIGHELTHNILRTTDEQGSLVFDTMFDKVMA